MKKAGISLLHSRQVNARNVTLATIKLNGDLTMKFDPVIVSQAESFVNALRNGKRARVPALKLEHWQQFMTKVYAGHGLA
ncbi:hypothetical protein SAMN06273570_5007 [Candidatus Pantoea floridensis]|uniref:Succinate dehydrogenase flavoprotein subunit n=1 Tax=Candidatus Pantoea floridensis TaxID=1938870 RepID=A0A286DRA2_9GAMM|nr:hypothetical protein BX596_5037 [Enterobacteriaceae bacterium JKS000233]SOD61176.1 hypothetical protein SAMN06273570_5007 [Pantoea floridensis]